MNSFIASSAKRDLQRTLHARMLGSSPDVQGYASGIRRSGKAHEHKGVFFQGKVAAGVDVCPVDCLREGPNMLVIDPEECIDCTLCVPECPVEAIFAEDDVPPAQRDWIPINAELSKLWKPIVERKPAPADAEEWAKVKEKKQLLER